MAQRRSDGPDMQEIASNGVDEVDLRDEQHSAVRRYIADPWWRANVCLEIREELDGADLDEIVTADICLCTCEWGGSRAICVPLRAVRAGSAQGRRGQSLVC